VLALAAGMSSVCGRRFLKLAALRFILSTFERSLRTWRAAAHGVGRTSLAHFCA
jgi:hypothetical protein